MTVDITLPEPHPAQVEILESRKRYNHIQCGRRFGKTELIAELASEIVLQPKGKPVGIFCPIERDFLKIWERLKNLYKPLIIQKNEQYHFMKLVTGGIVDMWSMNAVDNGRGEKYKRVILDEFAKAKDGRKSWEDTIRATLADYKGDSWFLSTPKGKLNYFCLLKEMHRGSKQWVFHHYTSYENPYLAREEIEDAKKTLDNISFQQEYLAMDVDRNEMPFLYTFDESKHLTKGLELDKSLPLWLSFDFNVQPMTCIIAQKPSENEVNVIDIAKRENASIYDMCDYLKVKYPGFTLMFTGDASGRNRSGTDRSKRSYWEIIQHEFNAKVHQFKYLRRKNLDHQTSQIICNSVLEHREVKINPLKELIDDITYASVDEYGKLIKTPDRGLHFFDGFRYLLDALFPDILKIK